MNNTLLFSMGVSLTVLSIATLTAIAAAIYIYKWRIKAADGESVVVVQDEFFRQIQKLYKKVESLESRMASSENQLKNTFDSLGKNTAENLNRIQNHLLSIESLADERSKEIERFREGHDFVKFKIFLKSIIYLIDDINEELEQMAEERVEDNIREKFEGISDELIILLDNNGVEQIFPKLGAPYVLGDKQYKRIRKYHPENAEQANTIKDVGKPGYQLMISNDQSIVIRPAEVAVYGRQKEENK